MVKWKWRDKVAEECGPQGCWLPESFSYLLLSTWPGAASTTWEGQTCWLSGPLQTLWIRIGILARSPGGLYARWHLGDCSLVLEPQHAHLQMEIMKSPFKGCYDPKWNITHEGVQYSDRHRAGSGALVVKYCTWLGKFDCDPLGLWLCSDLVPSWNIDSGMLALESDRQAFRKFSS